MKHKNILKLLSILMLIFAIAPSDIEAQNESIKVITANGQVLSEDSIPLSNIIIEAFSSKDVAVTDKDGNFSIKAAISSEMLVFEKSGFITKIQPLGTVIVKNNSTTIPTVLLKKQTLFDESNTVLLPFRTLKEENNVASVYKISGEDLQSYPTTSFLDALAGLLPGVYVTTLTSMPGSESQSLTIRGSSAVVYVDGVIRDPSDLSPTEVESVEVLRDLSGRTALGIYGSSPAIWITTKSGKSYKREIGVTTEYGINMATAVPKYVDAYDYATLYNEALVSDGYSAYYSEDALQAYKSGSDPVQYPNIDFSRYTRSASPFRRATIDFSGGNDKVNYFSMLNYAGSEGLESSVGEVYKNNRFKIRGNVNIHLNDFLEMNVNITGTYRSGRNPMNNIFSLMASMPANAHTTWFNDQLIITDDYPTNVENEMVYRGFNQFYYLSTQNNASIKADLSQITEGLSAQLSVALDASSLFSAYKYLSAPLYRIISTTGGADSTELVQEEVTQNDLGVGDNSISRKTVIYGSIDYTKTINKHYLYGDLAYYQGEFVQNSYSGYQPEKLQDYSLRLGYTFDDKYSLQINQVVSGSMRMPAGERFSLYPSAGLGWNLYKESFINSDKINYLKFTANYGYIGVNNFTLSGYNSYYLYETLWERGSSWTPGISGSFSEPTTSYVILQEGSDDYTLPRRSFLNVGLQGSFFGNSLSAEINYYRTRDYDILSQKTGYVSSLIGSGQFLPATNYGETLYYGLDGLIQYTKSFGDFNVSAGINALYTRGRYIVVDEPLNEEDYRKYAGHNVDEYLMYNAEGLFQSQEEIDNRDVTQSFGTLAPGDIIYTDYNNDGTIDEKDMYRTGAHSPRVYFGTNISLMYKGFRIKVIGQGATDGEIYILNDYFTSSGTHQNFSEALLNRWPETNDFPRVTTSSENNIQSSTFWLKDGTYYRLKNLELSYTFSEKTSRKISLNNLMIFVRGSNIAELSSVSQYGVDRENLLAGISYYPVYKTYTAGLSFNF